MGYLERFADFCANPLQVVADRLLGDFERLADFLLKQGFPVVHLNDFLLKFGEYMGVVEDCAGDYAAPPEARQVLEVNPALLHGRQDRLDGRADFPANLPDLALGAGYAGIRS
jgi:hypothetical protein